MKHTYETERLKLKILDKSYAGMVLDYYTRNRDFLKEWEPVRSQDFYTLGFHEEQLDKDLSEIESGRLLRLWIFKKEDDAKIIGSVAFGNIVRGAFLSCHLGYKLDKDEVNKGYITEALKKGIDIIFNDFGLHRIEANIMPRNKPSLRVVEKLGFCNEGLARKYLKINGKWEDHIHMVLFNKNLE
ncbi:MAG: GNAT family N-acetyltransferase [Clostridiaceae bacterium]|nr:GNAT family N-acetyltransferase [Clostridiaceae bacterium]